MEKKTYQFDYPANESSIIKVIGVGGGGSNAVNHMYNQGIRGVDFYICNTDSQALELSPIPNRIQIGNVLTKGLGAGANPEKGRNAALESKEEIRSILNNNTKMVFITAGMGGGTGTGAAPVIAQIAKEMEILTVGIVTVPFLFEGTPKLKRAEKGIEELRNNCDTVLIILNNKLREVYGNMSMKEAFSQADNVLARAAKSIAEIITVSGNINVDFEDVRTVMKDSGVAVMGSAISEGSERALKAVEGALTSPLLNNTDIFGSKYILLSIVVGDEDNFQFEELEQITSYVQEKAGEDTEIIFGQATDPSLGQSISVTVIATGFVPSTDLLEKKEVAKQPKQKIFDLASNRSVVRKIEIDYDDSSDFFEATPKKIETETLKKPEKVIFTLNEEADYFEEKKREEEKKKAVLEEQYRLRKQRLESLKSMEELSNEELQERKDIPAYLRKNVNLKETPHSSEQQLSRLRLTEDNEILGGNRFLHDNVD